MESQSRNSIIPIIILTALVTAIFVGGMVYMMSNSSKSATNGDLALLQEVRGLKQELKGEIADLRSEMKNNNEVAPAPSAVQPASQTQPVITPPLANNPQQAAVSVKSSVGSLYKSNQSQYEAWKKIFTTSHSDLRVYDAGSYAELSDGTKIVTFSYFAGEDAQSAGQIVALFDANNKLLRETSGLKCAVRGDVPTPSIDSVKDNKIYVSCTVGDAGVISKEKFEINISDFSFRKI